MDNIISDLAVSPVIAGPDAGKWITVKPMERDGTRVPVGFIFDFASLPWLARRFIARVSVWYADAVLLHDYRLTHERDTRSRKEIDQMFHKDLIAPVAKHRGLTGWYQRMRAHIMYVFASLYGRIKEKKGYASPSR